MLGVQAVTSAGHTPGHTVFRITSGDEVLVCVGDTFYDRIQLRRPEFATPYDIDREASVASHFRLLDQLADEGVLVHAYHMPFPGLGPIVRSGIGLRLDPGRCGECSSVDRHAVVARPM